VGCEDVISVHAIRDERMNEIKMKGFVKSDAYKPCARGYNWAALFLGDINTGIWPSRLGSLR
jgi:hypothetical protein